MVAKHIEVVPYNPLWPSMFETEATAIAKALGSNCIVLHHVGSTSVPGLWAKPIIDMIGVAHSPQEAILPLLPLGFSYKGEYNIPMHFGFSKKEGTRVHLHMYQEDHPEIALNLAFRDYLRAHPKARDDYAALKAELLKNPDSFEKKNGLFTGYNLGKDAFIRGILKKAGFSRLRMTKCTHHAEWAAVHSFHKKAFEDTTDCTHLILYQGVDIIGYALIHHDERGKEALQWLTIDVSKKTPAIEAYFLVSIKEWLMVQNDRSFSVSTKI